jgi:hypothetical protein
LAGGQLNNKLNFAAKRYKELDFKCEINVDKLVKISSYVDIDMNNKR